MLPPTLTLSPKYPNPSLAGNPIAQIPFSFSDQTKHAHGVLTGFP
jgi:hypothetical protein